MSGWLEAIVPHAKALHVAALVIWCAGVIALPLMLARHDPAIGQADYWRIRLYTHYAYTYAVTPAAVVAIGSGTLLIFAREAFVPWMFLKLLFVGVLVGAHGWVGHTIVSVAATDGRHQPPHPGMSVGLAMAPMLAILILVLAKPDLAGTSFPEWLTTPRGGHLLFEVPRR